MTAVDALDLTIERHLEALRTARRLSPNTLDAYRRDLADYGGFARRHRLSEWRQASQVFLDAYFD